MRQDRFPGLLIRDDTRDVASKRLKNDDDTDTGYANQPLLSLTNVQPITKFSQKERHEGEGHFVSYCMA